jgi:hypothetical protein
VRNGQARGLQRSKCRDCGKTFNALTGTPLARLRYRHRWVEQAQALVDGLSIIKATQRLDVARSTAFRWRHRFLVLPQAIKATSLNGIAEADETCILNSCKGQRHRLQEAGRQARHRAGRATRRGMSTCATISAGFVLWTGSAPTASSPPRCLHWPSVSEAVHTQREHSPGLTPARQSESAQFDSMPRSAIAAGPCRHLGHA